MTLQDDLRALEKAINILESQFRANYWSKIEKPLKTKELKAMRARQATIKAALSGQGVPPYSPPLPRDRLVQTTLGFRPLLPALQRTLLDTGPVKEDTTKMIETSGEGLDEPDKTDGPGVVKKKSFKKRARVISSSDSDPEEPFSCGQPLRHAVAPAIKRRPIQISSDEDEGVESQRRLMTATPLGSKENPIELASSSDEEKSHHFVTESESFEHQPAAISPSPWSQSILSEDYDDDIVVPDSPVTSAIVTDYRVEESLSSEAIKFVDLPPSVLAINAPALTETERAQYVSDLMDICGILVKPARVALDRSGWNFDLAVGHVMSNEAPISPVHSPSSSAINRRRIAIVESSDEEEPRPSQTLHRPIAAIHLADESDSNDDTDEVPRPIYSRDRKTNAGRHQLLAFLESKEENKIKLDYFQQIADTKRTGVFYADSELGYRIPSGGKPSGKSLISSLLGGWKIHDNVDPERTLPERYSRNKKTHDARVALLDFLETKEDNKTTLDYLMTEAGVTQKSYYVKNLGFRICGSADARNPNGQSLMAGLKAGWLYKTPQEIPEKAIELWSRIPSRHTARVELLAFLEEQEEDEERLKSLMIKAMYSGECHFFNIKRKQYWVMQQGWTYGTSLYSHLTARWRNNLSDMTKLKNIRKLEHLEHKETIYILYLAAVVHSEHPDFDGLYEDQLWEDLLNHPATKIEIYPGKYTSQYGFINMRMSHFSRGSISDIRTRLEKLGERAICLEIAAIPCKELYVAEQAEAFVMAYGDTWNIKYPGIQPSYLVTTPAAAALKKNIAIAQELAIKKVPLIQIVAEEEPRFPAPFPHKASLDELMKLPYKIHPSQIKERWLNERGGPNIWVSVEHSYFYD